MGIPFRRHSLAHSPAIRQKLRKACRSACPSAIEPLEPRMLLAAGPIDSELTIGASIYDYHWNPSIAMDHDGDYVIAWATGQRMGDTQIYAQRFNAVGVPQTAPLQLTDKPAIRPFWSDSIHLSAAMDDQHNFVVTWDDRTDDPRWADIYACHYDAATQSLGTPTRVNTFTDEDQTIPAVAMDANGNYVILWNRSTLSPTNKLVAAQQFDQSGQPLGTEFSVDMSPWDSDKPTVAMAPDGSFVALSVWWGQGLHARRYNAAGQAVGPDIQVSTMPYPNHPTVAIADNGQFAVAWEGTAPSDTDGGVYVRSFDTQGIPQGPESRANTYTDNSQGSPTIAIDPTGAWVVTWSSRDQDGSFGGIYAQRFDSTGQPDGGEFRINTYTTRNQAYPTIACDDNGDFLVAWSGPCADYGYGIHAQRFAATDSPASISGHAWNDSNGNGLQDPDESGNPGVAITLYTPTGLPIASTTSSADGSYQFTGLLPDQQFYLQVTPLAHTTLATPHIGLDDTRDSDFQVATARTDLFTCAQGQATQTFDVGMVPNTMITGTVFHDANGNGLQDAAEQGLPHWTVFVDSDLDGQLDEEEISTSTNQDGHYVFESLPPGDYTIAQPPHDLWTLGQPRSVSIAIAQTIAGVDLANTTAAPSAFLAPVGSELCAYRAPQLSSVSGVDIAIDAQGNSVVVWSGWPDATQWNVYGQLLNAAGVPQGDQFLVNTRTDGEQLDARVAMSANGDFVVVWAEAGHDRTPRSVRAQRYDAQGVRQGAELQVNPAGTYANYPSIAMDAQGNFAVAYSSDGICVQQFSAAGVPLGNPITPDISGQLGQAIVSEIAMAPDGRFVLIWEGVSKSGISGIYVQRFDNIGHPQNKSFRASTSTTGRTCYASVSMDSKGDFILSWEHQEYTMTPDYGEEWKITNYVRRFNADGVPQGEPFRPNSDPGNQFGGRVIMADSGSFICSWHANPGGSKAQLYNAAGIPQGEAIDFRGTSLAINASGDMIAAWSTSSLRGTVRVHLYSIASTDAVITGSANPDTFYLTRDGDNILVYPSSTPTGAPLTVLPLANTTSLVINGLTGTDRLFVDFSNGDPIPPQGLSFNGGSGKDAIVLLGTHDTDALSVRPSRILFNASRIIPSNIDSVTLAGGADQQIRLDSLAIEGAARLRLPTGQNVLSTNRLSITHGGMLDLIDNTLVIHATEQTRDQVLDKVTSLVRSGRSSGETLWQGPGIASRSAQLNPFTGLLVAPNSAADGAAILPTLNGLALAAQDVLVMYTRNGDLNLDGTIDAKDYQRIDTAFLWGGCGAADGDLNYDQLIDLADYFLIDAAYITQPSPDDSASAPDTPPADSPETPSAQPSPTTSIAAAQKKPDPVWADAPTTAVFL